MEIQIDPLSCTVILEESKVNTGEVMKNVIYKESTIILGRNEFRELIIQIFTKNSKKIGTFYLTGLLIHSRFVKEGKATLELVQHTLRQRVMISNCPSSKLAVFLKALSIKMELLKSKGTLNVRQKLQSDVHRTFEEISPLTMREIHSINSNCNESKSVLSSATPNRKRCRPSETDKENLNPQVKKNIDSLEEKLSTADCEENVLSLRWNLCPVMLTKEQKKVLEAIKRGKNVFFTGSAGTGKSFLLKRILGALPPDHTFVTASTGVAACQIGGTTLHAFAGIGSGKSPIEQCFELALRPQVASQWRKCKHLIIDEISMVTGDYFDKLEAIARIVRKTDEPFGGIQLIICGDFLQLPPVERGDRTFAFQAVSWSKCISENIELAEIWRQSDKKFIDILQHIRYGSCPDHVCDALKATAAKRVGSADIVATCLCTHNEDVDNMNNLQLERLSGDARCFEAQDSDTSASLKLDAACPVGKILKLKIGAQVILTKNMEISRGLVNGARGVVTGFEKEASGYPIVKFISGLMITVRPEKWFVRVAGGSQITRRQLPLRLAWAISIHKSQGMTLDCVEISLGRAFETGQAYVALSRARSLAGLRVLDFDKSCVRADSKVLEFYRRIKRFSDSLQNSHSFQNSQS